MRQNPENRRAVNEGLNDHRDEKEEARRMQKAIEGFSYRDMLNENAARFMSSAAEMSESRESFPFPGIELEVHTKMIATDREFPGYTTPVDTLLDRCRGEGIRVMLGKNPESGNVYIVPAGGEEAARRKKTRKAPPPPRGRGEQRSRTGKFFFFPGARARFSPPARCRRC